MKHGHGYRKLGRRYNHRRALLRNLTGSLIEHGRIRTTVAKAKSLRPVVEKLVTTARRALVRREGESEKEYAGRKVAAYRRVASYVFASSDRDEQGRTKVQRLFEVIAPKFSERPGGYTRIVRVGHRQGDNAPMAIIEFVEDLD